MTDNPIQMSNTAFPTARWLEHHSNWLTNSNVPVLSMKRARRGGKAYRGALVIGKVSALTAAWLAATALLLPLWIAFYLVTAIIVVVENIL